MSLVCGVYLRRPGAAFPAGWARHLRDNVDRSRTHTVEQFNDDRLLILKLDIGAFDAPGWRVSNDHVTALCGDAIFRDEPVERHRGDDMASLDSIGVTGLRPLLVRARGYFNLVHYDRVDHRLALAVDRVGVRSMYVYRNDDLLVFTGAMRLLETLPGIRLTADLQGVLEAATFGVPLSTRTRYKEVSCLRGGSQLLIDGAEVATDRYWKFDRDACNEVTEDLEAALDDLYARFQKAIRLRVGNRRLVFSALTGGLDSRSVTTGLWRLGLEVHSINVSWKGSQDQVLGGAYAAKLGLAHHSADRPLEEAGNSLARRLQSLLAENASLCDGEPGTARQLWSGNGGSLGLGHTKMSREVTEKLSAGDVPGGARLFLRLFKFNLSAKLLRSEIAPWAEDLPYQSLMSELEQIQCRDPARAMYIFRLEHDQRRLLAFHFEQIDLVPFEFIEPLFDPEVLGAVCKMPMAFCLGHHMYHEWLRRFPREVFSVAWQVYPGHEPCPVPGPPGTFDQWKPPRRTRRRDSLNAAVLGALSFLRRYRQFRPLLRTDRVLAAYAMRGLELGNTSHLLKQVEHLGAALKMSEGRIDAPRRLYTQG